jgi:aspartate carbamoyltransferase catalytic subunit
MKNLVSVSQLNKKAIESILNKAAKMEKSLKQKKQLTHLTGKVVACLFFEPSTRTRLSFETAVLRRPVWRRFS